MRQTLLALVVVLLATPLFSQNLFLEVYSGANFPVYEPEIYDDNGTYIPLGFRLAGGLPNVQLGGEYQMNLTEAMFETEQFDIMQNPLTNSANLDIDYYGGFIRVNISPNPAYGFGLVLKGGVGIYQVSEVYINRELFTNLTTEREFDYDDQLGFNGGIGASFPIGGKVHLELGYNFNFVKRESTYDLFENFNAIHHSFQIGFSYNFLFGEAARRYDNNKRWKNGWRGAAGKRYKNWKG